MPPKKGASVIPPTPIKPTILPPTKRRQEPAPLSKRPAPAPVFATPKKPPLVEWAYLWLLTPSFLGACGFWYSVRQLIEPHAIPVSWNIVLWWTACALVAVSIMVGCFLLVPVVISRRRWLPVMGLVAVVPLLWNFPLTWLMPLAGAIVVIGVWISSESIRREVTGRLRLDVRSILSHAVAWSVLAISLSVPLLQFDLTRTSIDPQRDLARLVERVVVVTETFLPKFLPAYRPEMTVDELVGSQIPTADTLLQSLPAQSKLSAAERESIIAKLDRYGLSSATLPTDGAEITAVRRALDQELERSRQSVIHELRNGLSEQLGTTLRGDERVHDALGRLLTERIGTKNAAYLRLLPPIIAIGLFLTLRLLSPLFETLVIAAGWGWYRVLRFARILRAKSIPMLAERLDWGRAD